MASPFSPFQYLKYLFNKLNKTVRNSTVEFTGHSQQRFPDTVPRIQSSLDNARNEKTEARKNPKQDSSPMFAERDKEKKKGGKKNEKTGKNRKKFGQPADENIVPRVTLKN